MVYVPGKANDPVGEVEAIVSVKVIDPPAGRNCVVGVMVTIGCVPCIEDTLGRTVIRPLKSQTLVTVFVTVSTPPGT